MVKIPNRIREFREAKGLTQDKLADLSDLSRPVISQFEKGQRTPSLKALKRIADVLNTSVDELLVRGSRKEQLRPEQKVLLRSFNKLKDQDRKVVKDLINRLSL